jgi:hypothetical protein
MPQKHSPAIPLTDDEVRTLAAELDPLRQALIPRVMKTTTREVPEAILVTAAKMLREHPALEPRGDVFGEGAMANLIPLRLVDPEGEAPAPEAVVPFKRPTLVAANGAEQPDIMGRSFAAEADPAQTANGAEQPDIMGRSFAAEADPAQTANGAEQPDIMGRSFERAFQPVQTVDLGNGATIRIFDGVPPADPADAPIPDEPPPEHRPSRAPIYQTNIRDQLLELEAINDQHAFAAPRSRYLVTAAARRIRQLHERVDTQEEELDEMASQVVQQRTQIAALRREAEENEKTIALLRQQVAHLEHQRDQVLSRIERGLDRLIPF